MIAGISDVVVLGLVSSAVTLIAAVWGGIVQRRNIDGGNNAQTQTKFYDNLMARVGQLEAEVSELREQLSSKDREVYELKLKIRELELKAEAA